MTVSSARAARSGTRRPCSYSCKARTSRPKRSANFRRLSFKRSRRATIPSAVGLSTIRQRSAISSRKMGKHFLQRRLDLVPHPGSFFRHLPPLSLLIAATSRDNALVSAAVRLSRSAFA